MLYIYIYIYIYIFFLFLIYVYFILRWTWRRAANVKKAIAKLSKHTRSPGGPGGLENTKQRTSTTGHFFVYIYIYIYFFFPFFF